jgi:hypothetical protein
MVFVVNMKRSGESAKHPKSKKIHTIDQHRLQKYGTKLFCKDVEEFFENLPKQKNLTLIALT